MKRGKLHMKRLNNRGFSLTELLVAVAILGVVSMTIYSFMIVGSQFYGKQASDADIQTEAQKIANTVTNLIIDCEANVKYDDASGFNFATATTFGDSAGKDAEGNDAKGLEITNTNNRFLIYPKTENNVRNLYYLEQSPNGGGSYPAYDTANAELLAQNVNVFTVDLNRLKGLGNGKNIISFTLVYEKGGRTYRGTYQVNLRNDITLSGNAAVPEPKEADIRDIGINDGPTIEIKGKNDPHIVKGLEGMRYKFEAWIVGDNITTDDERTMFNWSLECGDGKDPANYVVRDSSDEPQYKYFNAVFDDTNSGTVPSDINVNVLTTMRSKLSNTPLSATSQIHYVKVNSFELTAGKGFTQVSNSTGNLTTVGSTVVINCVTVGHHTELMTNGDCAQWKLEYRPVGTDDWLDCPSGMARIVSIIGNRVSNDRTHRCGTGVSIKLGDQADYQVEFRVTATNDWDPTWDKDIIFGVTQPKKSNPATEAARGVEISVTDYYRDMHPELLSTYGPSNPNVEKYIIKKVTINDAPGFAGHEMSEQIFKVINRDGDFFIYVDYDALAYTELNRLKEFYKKDFIVNIRVYSDVYYKDGHVDYNVESASQFVFSTPGITFDNGTTSTVVIPKGGSKNLDFVLTGTNISKKNMVGFYYKDTSTGRDVWYNENADEFQMRDLNTYLNVQYDKDVGNRYTFQNQASFKVSPKDTTSNYPVEPITCRVTFDTMYNVLGTTLDSYEDTSKYDYYASYKDVNVYIANVEGENIYIQGPRTSNPRDWKVITKANGGTDVVDYTSGKAMKITSPSAADVTFGAVNNSNGQVSYYTMQYNGNSYYWNESYHYWQKSS